MKTTPRLASILLAAATAACDAQDAKQPEKAAQNLAGLPQAEAKAKPEESDNGQKTDFAKWFLAARWNGSEDDVLHGLSAVQLVVLLATPQAKDAFAKAGMNGTKLGSVLTKYLKDAGIKVLDGEGWPKLLLLVETVDEGRGLAFWIRLGLMEEVAVYRNGKYIKAAAQTWEASYRGLTPYRDAGTSMGTSVDAVLSKFVAAFQKRN